MNETPFRLAGVIGWPVTHSRSPLLHALWLRHYNIRGAYVPLAVRPEHAASAIRALPLLGFAGANVTIPHKEVAFATVDRCDEIARRTRAVNTIIIAADGTLSGTNTDVFGFAENLRVETGISSLNGARVCVLGAGGAARAALIAMIDRGASDICIVNRSTSRAEELVRDLATPSCRLTVTAFDQRATAITGADLLVNTTSLGQLGQPPLPIDENHLATLAVGAAVADIVYVPQETAFITSARKLGLKVAPGLGMLLHQARPGFAAWFGQMPEVTPALRAALAADIPLR